MPGDLQPSMTSLAQQQYDKRAEPDRDPPGGVDQARSETEEEMRILLIRLAQGDSAATWILWQLYQPYLFDLCLQRMRGNHADAEDVLSQAMMKAWDRLPDYASEITDLRAWLTRLVHNLCLDTYRERQRRTKTVQNLDEMDEMAMAKEAALTQILESPEEAVLRHELYVCIQHAISCLPPRQRAPAILRFFHAMPYSEIAKHLTLSPENLRKCIQEARLILRERLNKYLSGVDGLTLEPQPEAEKTTSEIAATQVVQGHSPR